MGTEKKFFSLFLVEDISLGGKIKRARSFRGSDKVRCPGVKCLPSELFKKVVLGKKDYPGGL